MSWNIIILLIISTLCEDLRTDSVVDISWTEWHYHESCGLSGKCSGLASVTIFISFDDGIILANTGGGITLWVGGY